MEMKTEVISWILFSWLPRSILKIFTFKIERKTQQ